MQRIGAPGIHYGCKDIAKYDVEQCLPVENLRYAINLKTVIPKSPPIKRLHIVLSGFGIEPLAALTPELQFLQITSQFHPTHFDWKCVSGLKALKVLRIVNCQLSNVDSYFSTSPVNSLSLKELQLSDCQLRNIPAVLHGRYSLDVLDLSGNNLKNALHVNFLSTLSGLKVLRLARCGLSTIPPSWKSLRQLRTLDLQGSAFSDGVLPAVVSELVTLKELNLTQCKLTSLPHSMSSLANLTALHLSSNSLDDDFLTEVLPQFHKLKELVMSKCDLIVLPDCMSHLDQLEILDISSNKFNGGCLPSVVSMLTKLKALNISDCGLSGLPQSFERLVDLVELDISRNMFQLLPPVLNQLSLMKKLSSLHCQALERINREMLNLGNLLTVNFTGCTSLLHPPYGVALQGLTAIKKYFEGLDREVGVEQTVVPVVVLGNTMAGKTSIIRSLQAGERQFTYRQNGSPLDEATRVFKMERLIHKNIQFNFVDFGGQDVYHIAYQLGVKTSCVPLFVVNIEQYHQLATEKGSLAATRKLLFDYMSHLYLASPNLGPPILVLTHRDRVDESVFESLHTSLIDSSEVIRNEILNDEKNLSENSSDFCKISHFADTSKALLAPCDIFVFSNDQLEKGNIISLLNNLTDRCNQFAVVIPRLWEHVGIFFDRKVDRSYVLLSEFQAKFPDKDNQLVILRYFHNIGKIFWYEKRDTLASYIFHRISEITRMVNTVFSHADDDDWTESNASFTKFMHNNLQITKERYVDLLENFKEFGLMDEAILKNLIISFPLKVAIEILKAFLIIHGPVKYEMRDTYIVPYLCSQTMDSSWMDDGYLRLRIDISFPGLSLPPSVYQLMSVSVLNAISDYETTAFVTKNGIECRSDGIVTYLVHEFSKNQVTVQVSSDEVSQICQLWMKLLQTGHNIIAMTTKEWKAARPVTHVYCSHCIFTREAKPASYVDPEWFNYSLGQLSVFEDRKFHGVAPVDCKRYRAASKSRVPGVPKPLRLPCWNLSPDNVESVQNFLSSQDKLRSSHTSIGEALASSAQQISAGTMTQMIPSGSNTLNSTICAANPIPSPTAPPVTLFRPIQETAPGAQSLSVQSSARSSPEHPGSQPERRVEQFTEISNGAHANIADNRSRVAIHLTTLYQQQCALESEDGEDSELSDAEECIRFGLHSRQTSLDLVPCRKKRICRLYDTAKVYRMSDPVRGRILILNVNTVYQNGTPVATRPGSEIDFWNLSKLFQDLGFHIAKSEREIPNLTAERIYEEIEEETHKDVHRDMGMFGLVLMGHGVRGDYLLDIENQPVDLVKVKDMLSSAKFPAMHNKPKLMIIQACSSNELEVDGPIPSSRNRANEQQSRHGSASPQTSADLNAADFYIMKASGESFAAIRTPDRGSWFINMLVATFYKHACHRDIQSLFTIVQQRLGDYIAKYPPLLNDRFSLPVDQCTFTKYRKLFLFPGFIPKQEESSEHTTAVETI